jgi:hypothetical protein
MWKPIMITISLVLMIFVILLYPQKKLAAPEPEPVPSFEPATVIYDDIYLEYCAYPADSEAEAVLLPGGVEVPGDPDSCPEEIPTF